MPLFALANAGVSLDGVHLSDTTSFTVFAGVVLGLVIGKPLGIVGLSWIAVRLGWAMLPQGVSWGGMSVVGAAGGIGFTMAIFIGELAFADTLMGVGKLGVLVGTASASALALGIGLSISSRKGPRRTQAIRLSDVESSTEYWTAGEGT
jgi:NhaA family Na+:H+ antiporter